MDKKARSAMHSELLFASKFALSHYVLFIPFFYIPSGKTSLIEPLQPTSR